METTIASNEVERLLSVRETMARTGLKRSTLYEMIRDRRFPKPVPLTPRCTAFVESEVRKWIVERIASRDGDDAPRSVV